MKIFNIVVLFQVSQFSPSNSMQNREKKHLSKNFIARYFYVKVHTYNDKHIKSYFPAFFRIRKQFEFFNKYFFV